MSLSMQEYVIRLREVHQQMKNLSNDDGELPLIPEQHLAQALARASQAVPEFEQCWGDISVWIGAIISLLEQYHALADQLLEEEETAKIPTPSLVQRQ